MTTISDSRLQSLVTQGLANLHSWMLSHRRLVQLWKMKNLLSFTSRQLTTLTMHTNTRSYTSTCQEKNAIINTSTSTSMGPQHASSCSTLQREAVSKRLSSGSMSVIDAKSQSRFLLEIWSTLHQDQWQNHKEINQRTTTMSQRLRPLPLLASTAWNTSRLVQLVKLFAEF